MKGRMARGFAALLFAISYSLYAPQSVHAKESSAFEFLTLGASPRALAMGGAGAAQGDDALSAFWNPAAVGGLDRHDVSFAHARWLEQFRYQALGWAGPLASRWAGGVSVLHISRGGIQGFDDGGAPSGELDVSGMAAAGTLVHDVGPWFGGARDRTHFGLSAKFVREDLSAVTASGAALDAGFRALPYSAPQNWLVDRVQVGVSVANLGPAVKFERDEEALPLVYRAGVAVRGWARSLTAAADYEKPLRDPGSARFGAEYRVLNALALRAGYRWALKDNRRSLQAGYHLGLGFQIGDLWIDYALVPFQKLDDTHFMGLRWAFGANTRLEQVERRIHEHYVAAQRAYARKDFPRVQREVEQTLVLDPSHAGARALAAENGKQLATLQAEREIALGKRRLRYEDYGVALEHFRNVLNVQPAHAEAQALAAETEKRLAGQLQLRRDALIVQGEEFFEQGRYGEAVDLWEKVLLIDPQNQKTLQLLSQAKERWEEQKRVAAEAEEQKRLEQGWVHFKGGHFEKARRVAADALAKNPGSEGAQVLLSQAQGRLADDKVAEGRRHLQAGRHREAYALLKEAGELDPKNQIATELLGEARKVVVKSGREEALSLYEGQKYEQALERLEFLISVDPQAEDLISYRTQTKRKLVEARQVEAERLHREALKAYDEGNLAVAVKHWKQVLELVPDHANAKRNLERAKQQLNE
jgi:tetratricopeptide (TPR) repeat protein